MKKTIFAVVAVMALLFTSCEKNVKNIDASKLDNTVNKCWKITFSKFGVSASSYMWCTERECVEALQTSSAWASVNASYSVAAAADADACYKLEEEAANN